MKVWILFMIPNNTSNEPSREFSNNRVFLREYKNRVFLKLFFRKPKSEDIGARLGFGRYCKVTKDIAKMNLVVLPKPYCSQGNMYWVEEFSNEV